MQLRLTITNIRRTQNVCQLSELNLYDEAGNKVAWVSGTNVTAPNASYSSSESPSKLIDGSASTKFCCTNYTSFSSGLVILFDIPERIIFSQYSYVTGNDSNERDPITWKLEYSDDGTKWAVASEVANATITTSRRAETQKWDATILFAEKKYLIYDDSTQKYYSVVDNALNELSITSVTANDFLTYGNDEPPLGEILISLQKPSILYWQDSGDLPILTAQVTATPYPQNVISKRIDLSHDSITGIENMIAECDGELICAVSFDNKQTWKAWNGEVWATLTEDFTGMSKETLEGITFEQWNELYSGADSLYIRISLVDTTQTVAEIVVDFSN